MPTLHLYPDCARSDLEIRVLDHRLPADQSGSTRSAHLLRKDATLELPLPHHAGKQNLQEHPNTARGLFVSNGSTTKPARIGVKCRC